MKSRALKMDQSGNGSQSGYSSLKPLRDFGASGYSHDDDNGFIFTEDWSGEKERKTRAVIKQETFEKHASILADYANLTHIPLEKQKIDILAARYDLAPYSVGIILKKGRNIRHLIPADSRKAA